MAYNSISIKPYIKSHLELQREITLIELAPNPYFFVLSICLAYMNMFARFDENPAMTLHSLRKQNVTDGRTHRQRENSIPTTKFAGGITNYCVPFEVQYYSKTCEKLNMQYYHSATCQYVFL